MLSDTKQENEDDEMKRQFAIVNKVEHDRLFRTFGEVLENFFKQQFFNKEAELWLSQVLTISWYRLRKSIIALEEAQRFLYDK